MIRAHRSPMRIILGCDHRGREITQLIFNRLKEIGQYQLSLSDSIKSEPVDYPDIAFEVARKISVGDADWGILVCGTGIGMCVVANKFSGVRAAPCHNAVVAELSRKHNNSNILCLSGDMLGERSCLAIVETWLSTPFAGGRHQERLNKIDIIEQRYRSVRTNTEKMSSDILTVS